ncbi:uncharacterized protein B0J16DRAFT_393884 [Fusarium flagelliforme]|uniref:uncharacterized protein n=1 Tax=Fusarium flagelliforme TaxID=2675880 RepID=UPI001E8EC3B5|nr:uncharacterized protein B0J16DRAFT_393884 [Fusarium flagelliforme]KAH7191837.1 hypothetical protein B0J16DRAFT_393884 [Fusarium flagelliforme]
MDFNGSSTCEMLKKAAEGVYLLVLFCGMRRQCRLAGEVATKLGLIAGETLAKYEVDDEVEALAAVILRMLSQMCIFPQPVEDRNDPRQDYRDIALYTRPDRRALLEECISNFFFYDNKLSGELRAKCDLFLSTINQDEPNQRSGLERLTAGSRLPEPDDYPSHVIKNLFTSLHWQAYCKEKQEQGQNWLQKLKPRPSVDHPNLPHPVRLHLDTMPLVQDSHAQFEVIISSESMSYWQYLRLGIPVRTKGRKGRIAFADAPNNDRDSEVVCTHKRINPDYFCQILKRQLFNNVKLNFVKGVGLVMLPPPAPLERFLCAGEGLRLSSVIQHYELKDKDKFVLAHSIANSFWRFYGTDLMRQRWTSHDVWFMQERDHHNRPKDQIALQAFLPLEFADNSTMPEELKDEMSTHPFPHILGLGIVLLEIGLSQPYISDLRQPLISRLNRDHGHAMSLLGRLEKAPWSRPSHRDIFARAIESCLDPSKFMVTDETFNPDTTSKASEDTSDKGNSSGEDSSHHRVLGGISTTATGSRTGQHSLDTGAHHRRNKLFREIVEPLAKLAKVAFKTDQGAVSYLERRKVNTPSHSTTVSQLASFHIGKTVIPKEWLDNLKHISGHISRLRQRKEYGYESVKIAILDTGYDPQLKFFKNPRRAECIKASRDFTSHDRNGYITDTTAEDCYGHGSLMTRLVMEAAPLAQICVGRVAENTTDLDNRAEEIAKVAIRWAGLQEQVDIISMSFGFPLDNGLISRAIEEVERERSIIFLASAGNNAGYQGETFPARHKSVISVRATDSQGTFAASNPLIDEPQTLSLGTFGDDLPDGITKDISDRFGSHVCDPGSSIATAVAAGIAASTISYAEVLSVVLSVPAEENPVRSLKTGEGMRRLLGKMAPGQTGNYRFVNPIWFWYENRNPWSAWVAISHAVSPLRSRHDKRHC